jgi:endoglucanase
MKKRIASTGILFLILFPVLLPAQNTIVKKYGQLSVKGNYILGQYGDTVQLRGMSLFWSQWMPQYYDAATVKWLRDDWKSTVIRAAMGVESGGYLENPGAEKEKIKLVVDAAIEHGIYVIIDYHSHEAHKNPTAAKKFFAEMAKKYGQYPNVLYEIYNEPLQNITWKDDIKPYADTIVKTIRQYDPDNIIICGTRQWSQLVTEAATLPIQDKNTVYTLHFYAVSHGQYLRDEAKAAMDKGIAIFVSEFGTCDYTGGGELGLKQTNEWFEFLDKYKISWCNWSVADKDETSAILKPRTGPSDWEETNLTPSGIFIRNEIRTKNKNVLLKSKK